MPRVLDLPNLVPGDRVEDTLLVVDAEDREFDGRAYTILTFGNASGRLPSAPFWPEERAQVEGIRRGHVVQVIGEVAEYRGRRQMRVPPASSRDEHRHRALLPSVGDVSRYWETLDGWRREIRRPRLARVLSLLFDDDTFRRRFEQCPASIAGHHAALGSLLRHTVEVGAIARTIARVSGADADLVLAGVLLHDIGKLEAYRWDGLFDHTEAHYLVGHVVLGALMLAARLDAEPQPPCTPEERLVLAHLILSHHGKREFGSPVPPLTLEAEVLHWADNASAHTASFTDALREAESGISSRRFCWTSAARSARGATGGWGTRPEPGPVRAGPSLPAGPRRAWPGRSPGA
jgi:3'-5' exoribonuclease